MEQLKPGFWNEPLDVYYIPPKPPGFVGPMPQVQLKQGEDYHTELAEKSQVVLGIDPGHDSDRISIVKMQRILTEHGYKVEVLSAESFPRDSEQAIVALNRHEFDIEMIKRLPQPVMVFPEEEPESKPTQPGPKRSKYQRGKWWNR